MSVRREWYDFIYAASVSAKQFYKSVFLVCTASMLIACDNYNVVVYDEEKTWDGYVVPSGMLGGPTHIVDTDGSVVKQFDCPGYPAKLLPDGSLMCNNLTLASLTVPQIRQVSAAGDILWTYGGWFKKSIKQHHDYQVAGGNPVGYYVPGMDMIGPADGGNVLVLTHWYEKPSQQDVRWTRIQDDIIYEIDPAGNILWEWHASDHIDEMGFSESALRDIYFRLFSSDWLHINTVSYVGPNKWYEEFSDERFHPDNIIIGSPKARWIAIIDKLTGSIVWRLGPDYSEGNPGHEFGGVAFSHHAHVIPKGLPGEGNILIYDNGFASGYGDQKSKNRPYSRILEINPIDYSVVWQFQGYKLYSPNMSSVQRLPNGNTFIAEGLRGRMIEVTPNKEVVWEARGQPLYRAYKVPREWVDEH
ncbi:MAG: aryl-sulfate sulfotransferase [Pseudomonadales bacterium]|nr:aryl-sulfate sulfotransferase [Pseudomonadales bacterium]